MKVCCPNCNSNKVRSYDNECLYHPNHDRPIPDSEMKYDNEVYIMFQCDECKSKFTITFDIVKQGTEQLLREAYALLINAGIELELVDKIEKHLKES